MARKRLPPATERVAAAISRVASSPRSAYWAAWASTNSSSTVWISARKDSGSHGVADVTGRAYFAPILGP